MSDEPHIKLDQDGINLLLGSASAAIQSQCAIFFMLFGIDQGQRNINALVAHSAAAMKAVTETKEPTVEGTGALH